MNAEKHLIQGAVRLDGALEMSALLRGMPPKDQRRMAASLAKVLDTFPPGQRWEKLDGLLARLDDGTASAADRALVAGCRLDVLRWLSRMQAAY
jgi:hypothetical protein